VKAAVEGSRLAGRAFQCGLTHPAAAATPPPQSLLDQMHMPFLRKLVIASGLFPAARRTRQLLWSPRTRREEAAKLAFYRALVAPGALVFDIGANVGSVACHLLAAGARVVAVEPQPECLDELRAAYGRNPQLSVLPVAVGDAPGVAALHLGVHNAASSLRPDWFGPRAETLDVPVLTLAALIERYGIPAYCKVDVEGAEERVFATLGHALPLVSFEYLESEPQVAAACVRRLAAYGEAEINFVGTGVPRFRLERWLPAEAFLASPATSLPPGPGWGDLWVRAAGQGAR
jgi:FkbM family methyltransferase